MAIESKNEALRMSIIDLKRSLNNPDLERETIDDIRDQITWLEFIREELREYDALKVMLRKIVA